MRKLRVLDLYCGAGGAGAGYMRAGYDVIGVDASPMPRYPGPFIQADVLSLDLRFLRHFDLIHASPPCQAHTLLKHAPNGKAHLDLIPQTRELLLASGVPYIIENVPGAAKHLRNPICLCGTMFGLGATVDGQRFELQRHRLFEMSDPPLPPPCQHHHPVIGIYGGHVRQRGAKHGGRKTVDFAGRDRPALAREAMDIYWMTMGEMSQAIPPAYTERLGLWMSSRLERKLA